MDWELPAIVIGALIVVSRVPLIFRPLETLAFYRGLWASDARARALAGLYAVLALACFGAVGQTSGLPLQLLVFLGALLLAIAAWMLLAPGNFRAKADGIFRFVEESVDTAVIRGLGVFAVSIGALLVNAGVRAL